MTNELVAKRGAIKRRITGFEKAIEVLDIAALQSGDKIVRAATIASLAERCDGFKNVIKDLEAVQLQIDLQIDDAAVQDSQDAEHEDNMNRYYTAIGKAKSILHVLRCVDDSAGSAVVDSDNVDVAVGESAARRLVQHQVRATIQQQIQVRTQLPIVI